MKIKFVPRSNVRVSKKSSSKFRPLIDALNELEPGGDALEVTYANEKELNSMRNVVYTFNRETGQKVKSGKDTMSGKVFFYKEKK
ncbi:hypothetical protein QLX67_00125 [Balneolaceae bacterium ANBcel3]|nr:hypothetical protein [Balneolaceae bacterium ANBcel3]